MKKILLEQTIWFSSEASKKLKSLEPVFNELLSVHLAYILGESGKDYPFWYGERSHVGFLAAAVWKYGGTAVEEFKTSKSKNKSSKGRCDLWIRINKKIGFECEAKRLWVDLDKKVDDLTKKIKNRMD